MLNHFMEIDEPLAFQTEFFWGFFQALSELPEEACLPKEPQPTQN